MSPCELRYTRWVQLRGSDYRSVVISRVQGPSQYLVTQVTHTSNQLTKCPSTHPNSSQVSTAVQLCILYILTRRPYGAISTRDLRGGLSYKGVPLALILLLTLFTVEG